MRSAFHLLVASAFVIISLGSGSAQEPGDCLAIEADIAYIINDEGAIPSQHLVNNASFRAITWDIYFACINAEVGWVEGEIPSGSPPDGTPGYGGSDGAPSVASPIDIEANLAAGPWKGMVQYFPAKPGNAKQPENDCNYNANEKAVSVIESTFNVDFGFNCYWNYFNPTDTCDINVLLDDAKAQSNGLSSGVAVWLAIVDDGSLNGLQAGDVAIYAEDPCGSRANWPNSVIAQHEMSHRFGAAGDVNWKKSVMHYWGGWQGDTWYYRPECLEVVRYFHGPHADCVPA